MGINYANGALPVNAYATADDLKAWLAADPPDDATRLLGHAQRLVDSALTSSMFTTDANGNPTDAGVIAALRDATCAQVEDWIVNGDETNSQDFVGMATVDGLTISRAGGRAKLRLCDRAYDILKAAKLKPGTVVPT